MRWNPTKMSVTAAVFLLFGLMVVVGEHRVASADDSATVVDATVVDATVVDAR